MRSGELESVALSDSDPSEEHDSSTGFVFWATLRTFPGLAMPASATLAMGNTPVVRSVFSACKLA